MSIGNRILIYYVLEETIELIKKRKEPKSTFPNPYNDSDEYEFICTNVGH